MQIKNQSVVAVTEIQVDSQPDTYLTSKGTLSQYQ